MTIKQLNEQLGELQAVHYMYRTHPGLNQAGFDLAQARVVSQIAAAGGIVDPIWPATVIAPDGGQVLVADDLVDEEPDYLSGGRCYAGAHNYF
jgi:hypothetical protein